MEVNGRLKLTDPLKHFECSISRLGSKRKLPDHRCKNTSGFRSFWSANHYLVLYYTAKTP